MTIIWKGTALLKKMDKAQIVGINRTLGQAVEKAKNNHQWKNRTGTLEGSIAIVLGAVKKGKGFIGKWGSRDVVYALIHELGGVILPKKKKKLTFKIGGSWVSVSRVVIPARPYLRPAADAAYPNLGKNIKNALAEL